MFLLSKFKNDNLVEIQNDEFEDDIKVDDKTIEDEAAIKLQKVARGFITRKNQKIITHFEDEERTVMEDNIKDEDEDEDEDEDDDYDIEDDIEDDDINNLYVISVNNVPFFYESELKVAQKKMLYMTRVLNYKNNVDYNDSYIRENYSHPLRTNSIDVIRKYSCFFFSFETVLHSLKIDVVKPYDDNDF